MKINNAEEMIPDELEETGIRLLIVADDFILSKYLQEHLNDFYAIDTVNGIDAYQLVLDINPDIIISEVIMQEMDGIELCSKLKSNYLTSHIPVILLSAKSDNEQKIKGLCAGADANVERPFEIDYITALIENLLVLRQKLRERFSEHFNFIENKNPLKDHDKTFIEKIEEIVNENISNPDFSLKHLISAANMCRSQLYRKFKLLINSNPGEYIRNIRLKYAVNLLHQRKYNVNEIADMSGFANVSHFITCFKKNFGKSPRRYMESQSSDVCSTLKIKYCGISGTERCNTNAQAQSVFRFSPRRVRKFDHLRL
ncbi:MAG: helix-turn-helix domain-containing protein [Bacteroidales bacterium]|nr:helix-turn-helix domain-containing protein [Bacteroidales bacterium]